MAYMERSGRDHLQLPNGMYAVRTPRKKLPALTERLVAHLILFYDGPKHPDAVLQFIRNYREEHAEERTDLKMMRRRPTMAPFLKDL